MVLTAQETQVGGVRHGLGYKAHGAHLDLVDLDGPHGLGGRGGLLAPRHPLVLGVANQHAVAQGASAPNRWWRGRRRALRLHRGLFRGNVCLWRWPRWCPGVATVGTIWRRPWGPWAMGPVGWAAAVCIGWACRALWPRRTLGAIGTLVKVVHQLAHGLALVGAQPVQLRVNGRTPLNQLDQAHELLVVAYTQVVVEPAAQVPYREPTDADDHQHHDGCKQQRELVGDFQVHGAMVANADRCACTGRCSGDTRVTQRGAGGAAGGPGSGAVGLAGGAATGVAAPGTKPSLSVCKKATRSATAAMA